MPKAASKLKHFVAINRTKRSITVSTLLHQYINTLRVFENRREMVAINKIANGTHDPAGAL